ncbi:hypothetical protein B296_00019609 [Ensete ventricosum]|uniref:Uncharacterized protein n=1 Tax=Ensete ventricosum TaxID=4639 RepID=A0A426ZNI9_ENSVE|nr:hypothetical protein B296_00019609 [Ensete ventricosum]
MVEVVSNWMKDILRYKRDKTLLADLTTVQRLRRAKAHYCKVRTDSTLAHPRLDVEGREDHVRTHAVRRNAEERGGGGQPHAGGVGYGLLVRRKMREGYKVLEGVAEPDISMHHGLIKGLLRLRRAGEATQVFRATVERGIM